MKSTVIALLSGLDLTVGSAVSELKNLNAMRIIGSWGGKGQGQHSTTKGKVGVVTIMDSKAKAATRIVLLADHGVCESKVESLLNS